VLAVSEELTAVFMKLRVFWDVRLGGVLYRCVHSV